MRTAKHHPYLGFLFLEPRDYSSTFDKLLILRDEELKKDPSSSGMPQAFKDWVMESQLPQLLTIERYRNQFKEHLNDLKTQALELEARALSLAGSTIDEKTEIETKLGTFEPYLEG